MTDSSTIYLFYKGVNSDNGAFKAVISKYRFRYLFVPGPIALPDVLKDLEVGIAFPNFFAVAVGDKIDCEVLERESNGEFRVQCLTLIGTMMGDFMTWFDSHNIVKKYRDRFGYVRTYKKIKPVVRPSIGREYEDPEAKRLREDPEREARAVTIALYNDTYKQIYDEEVGSLYSTLCSWLQEVSKVMSPFAQRYRDAKARCLMSNVPYSDEVKDIVMTLLVSLDDYIKDRDSAIRECSVRISDRVREGTWMYVDNANMSFDEFPLDPVKICSGIIDKFSYERKYEQFKVMGSRRELFDRLFSLGFGNTREGVAVYPPSSSAPRVVRPRPRPPPINIPPKL